jgi:hypothetical protein
MTTDDVYADILCRRASLLNDYEFYRKDEAQDLEEDTFNISVIQKFWDGKKDDKRKSLIGHNVQIFNKSLACIATNYATDEDSLTTSMEGEEEGDDGDEVEESYESSDTSGPVVNKKMFNFKSMKSRKIFKLWYKLENELEEIEKTYPKTISQNVEESLKNLVQSLKNRIEEVKVSDDIMDVETSESLLSLKEITSQLAVRVKAMKEKLNLAISKDN